MGLDRTKVLLETHNNMWAYIFRSEKEVLTNILGNAIVDIQHVGSTSIPELKAKPIIDIALLLDSKNYPQNLIDILESEGYHYRANSGSDERMFFAKGSESNRTHYLHVHRYEGKEWIDQIYFRDYLIGHKDKRKEYEKIKEQLAEKYPDDRFKYTAGKDSFIKSILETRKGENK